MRWVRGLGVTVKSFTYVLTTVSAAFYAASFLSESCWFFSFFSLSPLFLTRFLSWHAAFYHGYLWGAIAYTAVLSDLLEVMWCLGFGSGVVWYIVGFIGYFTFLGVFWFCAAKVLASLTKSWQVGWLLASFMYWVWMRVGFFYFITGRLQGYGLALPFLPLMEHPALLSLLPIIRWWGMLAVVLVFHLAVAQKRWWLITLGILFFVGSCGYAMWQKQEEKKCENIALISGGFTSATAYERAHEVCEKLLEAEQQNPQAQLLVLPESAFPYPLNEHGYALEMWSSNGKLHEKYLVVGTHYACQGCGKLHNSACVIHEGNVIYRYDKRGMLPFFEEEVFATGGSPFLCTKKEMKAGCEQASSFVIPGMGAVTFRVCSELLWDMPKNKRVIALVHDGHYRYSYFPRLFKWYAQMSALEKQSELLYCGWQLKRAVF